MHGPCLSSDDRARWEGVPHKVKGFVDGFTLGHEGGDDTFEEAGCGAVDSKA